MGGMNAVAELVGYIPAPALAADMEISRSRLHQLIEELVGQTGIEIGVMVGTTRLLSRAEAAKLRQFHKKKRAYTKSAG